VGPARNSAQQRGPGALVAATGVDGRRPTGRWWPAATFRAGGSGLPDGTRDAEQRHRDAGIYRSAAELTGEAVVLHEILGLPFEPTAELTGEAIAEV